MKYNIDYHFHPNLPKNDKKAEEKCKKIWEVFKANEINTVIVTEHSFKDSKRAFEFMKKTKPDSCFVFPGMEYLTREGIDVVLFHSDESIYERPELTSYNLTLDETIELAKKYSFACCIAHPHSLGKAAILKKMGPEKYQKYLNVIKAVEVSNSSFNNLVCLLNKPAIGKIFQKNIEKIKKTRNLPISDRPENAKFLSVGSDAHHPEEIGTFCTINATHDTLFEKITHNLDPKITEKVFKKTNAKLLFLSGLLAFSEYIEKKKVLIKRFFKS